MIVLPPLVLVLSAAVLVIVIEKELSQVRLQPCHAQWKSGNGSHGLGIADYEHEYEHEQEC